MENIIWIAHRGNINGKSERENEGSYIDEAISQGYDVEVDVWLVDDNLFLGHDEPQYKIGLGFLVSRSTKLWIHAKNLPALSFLHKHSHMNLNFFYHQTDDAVLTSKGYIWTYPGKELFHNSIAVKPDTMPEKCQGICSDYVELFKNQAVQKNNGVL